MNYNTFLLMVDNCHLSCLVSSPCSPDPSHLPLRIHLVGRTIHISLVVVHQLTVSTHNLAVDGVPEASSDGRTSSPQVKFTCRSPATAFVCPLSRGSASSRVSNANRDSISGEKRPGTPNKLKAIFKLDVSHGTM